MKETNPVNGKKRVNNGTIHPVGLSGEEDEPSPTATGVRIDNGTETSENNKPATILKLFDIA